MPCTLLDLAGAQLVDLNACHRCYLYQQAYEKSLKAYAT